MMYSNVIVDITISRGSFVFSQSRVQVSASLANVGSLAVGAFDLVNCSLSVVGFVPVFERVRMDANFNERMPQAYEWMDNFSERMAQAVRTNG